MKRFSLLILLVINSILVSGQDKFSKGYIVLPSMDTITGYLQHDDFTATSKSLKFRIDDHSEIQNYDVTNIISFNLNGEIYRRAVVLSDISDAKVYDEKEMIIKAAKDTTFLQLVMNGPLSLYVYKNKRRRVQIYLSDSLNQYQWLEYKEFELDKDGSLKKIPLSKYKTQLYNIFKDEPKVSFKLQNIKYNIFDIKSLLEDYFSRKNIHIEVIEKKKKMLYEYGVMGGIMVPFGNFIPAQIYSSNRRLSLKSNFNPQGGIFIDVSMPKSNFKWSFRNEIIYSSNTFETADPDVSNVVLKYFDKFFIENQNIRLMTSVNRRVHFKNSHIRLGLGFTSSFLVSDNEIYYEYNVFDNGVYSNISKIKISLSRVFYKNSYFGTFGYQYKNFGAAINLELASINHFYSNVSFGVDARPLHVMLTYRIH